MADHRCFGDYLSPAAQYRELVLLDQRGCGESADGPAESYTIERLSDDVEDIRSALGHETIDLLAYSFGGVVGVRYAQQRPERLRRLVFVDAPVTGWYGPLIEPKGWPLWLRAMLFPGGKDGEFHLKHEVANKAKTDDVRRLLAVKMRYDENRVRPLVSASMRRNRLETLVQQVPTFGIYGRQDRRFIGDAKYLARIGASVVFVERAGHFPFVEQPDAFHHALRQFLGC